MTTRTLPDPSPSPAPLAARVERWREQVRDLLDAEIAAAPIPEPLRAAVRYGSTAAPASRWRAVLVLEVGRVVGADSAACLFAAAAVEALHCATLSVDDLPCMDDASQRRGQPAMHRRFNEALAIQAALWLLGLSRSLGTRAATAGATPPDGCWATSAAALAAAQQTTEDALHRGQFLDMMGMLGRVDVDAEEVALLKCGRLFGLAAQAPAWLPASRLLGAELQEALLEFGAAVGVAYQIRDDLDDAREDEEAASWRGAGVPGRPTVVAALGRDAAADRVDCFRHAAARALEPLAAAGFDAAALVTLADRMLGRPE